MTFLTILTDANGFTTCCAQTREAMLAEVSRVPLLSPIQVFEWVLTGGLSWQLRQTYAWSGAA